MSGRYQKAAEAAEDRRSLLKEARGVQFEAQSSSFWARLRPGAAQIRYRGLRKGHLHHGGVDRLGAERS